MPSMNPPTIPTLLAAAWLAILTAAGSSRASELSKVVSPLIRPDFASARRVVAELEDLAGRQSGNEKVRTQRLTAAIRNLFTAEFQVAEAVKAIARAERDARRLEKNASDWLKPNAFGSVNVEGAEAAIREARETRQRAAAELPEARARLAAQAHELEVVMRNFHDLGDLRLVIRLGETLHAVLARSLGGQPYQTGFPEPALACMKESVASSNEWLNTAADAERSHVYELALRYFTMAGDEAGRRRCAAALVPELTAAGLHGSAIEALEIAGDSRRAQQLRNSHPDLRAVSFRTLPDDELLWRVSSCCVRITNGESHGAGVFFRRGGFILVHRSLVASDPPVIVRLDDERLLTATVIARSESSGFAIVRVPLARHQVLAFASDEDISPAARVRIPILRQGTSPPALQPARITDTKPLAADPPAFRLDLPAGRHPAGTPVVDNRGHILGILHPTADGGPPATFAVPAGAARKFAEKHIISGK